mgnify:CR=1 FL=1
MIKNKTLQLALIGSVFLVSCQMRNVSPNTSAHSTSEITYESTVKYIIDNNCLGCHSGRKPSAGLKLDSYDKVKNQIVNGDLLKRINSKQNPMPKRGLMSKNQRLAIEEWARKGFVEVSKGEPAETGSAEDYKFVPPTIKAIDVSKEGFNFFNLMQGHWVGDINLMGEKIPWFAFDYRPISEAHIHGIFEGGTMGNLFTSFFIADYKGTKTIMARNGGILNGIYRTSYFVLDKVELSDNENYFRLVDAYGGQDIMWMELRFTKDKLSFKSYTSRFGLTGKAKKHMEFKGEKMHVELSNETAKALNYPQNKIQKDFSKGMPTPNWGEEYTTITSASYLYQDSINDLVKLGELAQDPFPINDIPYLASLKVDIEQNKLINMHGLLIYLSKEPLTDEEGKIRLEYGYIKEAVFNTVLSSPAIIANESSFTFNYLHPSNYYITVVADVNKDGYISKGDITSASRAIKVDPKSNSTVAVKNIQTTN